MKLIVTQSDTQVALELGYPPPAGPMAAWAPVEAFGAKGDGVTDDTAALNAALASGRPLRFQGRTYMVAGQWTIAQPAVLIGVQGQTVLRRISQAGNGAFVAVQGASFRADGITFDANKAAITTESWGVLVTSLCSVTTFSGCTFTNAVGSTLGSGLVIQASDPVQAVHSLVDCDFSDNTAHGLWVQAVRGVQVTGCRGYGNGQYGINVDYNDVTFVQKAHQVVISGCSTWSNVRGINVGNFSATNTSPPVWGNANPDALAVVVADCNCHDNTIYGIAASGRGLLIASNVCDGNGHGISNGAGILANVSWSAVRGNQVIGDSTFGIDAGGSVHSDFFNNGVDGANAGINAGGGINNRVFGNLVTGFAYAGISVLNVEADGAGNNFGLACSGLTIAGNQIEIGGTNALGVVVLDGAQGVVMTRNDFLGSGGALAAQCLQASTDGVTVESNRFDGTVRTICNPDSGTLIYPDIADEIEITSASASVTAMVSAWQSAIADKVGFVKITAAGSGYTHATLALGGSGTGAAATAVISGGALIGAVLSAAGSGYGALGSVVAVTVTGDGTGAAASGIVGVPVPDGRKLRVQCQAPVTFARAGSVPFQDNPLGTDLGAPVRSWVDWEGINGGWLAGGVSSGGGGSGSVTLTGDVTGSGTGTVATTLGASGVTAGTYGGITVDAKGRISSARQPNSSDVTTALGYAPVNPASIGAANGVASLDGSGKLPSSELPASITGAVVYQGTWNAGSNSPTLTSSTGTKGWYYKVSVAGTHTLDGVSSWGVGDTVIFDGAAWDKIDGQASEVISVNGQAGAVLVQPLPLVTNTYTASGTIAPTDNLALVNAATAVAMTLAASAADGHEITIKRYGSGSVTLTADIDGVSGAVVIANSSTLKESMSLVWAAGPGTWLAI